MLINEKVKIFPGLGGWTYIDVPVGEENYFKKRSHLWGMIPVTATFGATTWNTKLMKKSKGGYFLALPKKVRTQEGIKLNDFITVELKF